MLIGILSDTHDDADATGLAIATLRHAGAVYFIHCGDVGGERVLDQLAGLDAVFIWGNNDVDRVSLQKYAQSLNIICHGDFADLGIEGKRLAVIHGDDLQLKRRLLADGTYDYLLQGHTHLRQDKRVGKTRVINPGACIARGRRASRFLTSTKICCDFWSWQFDFFTFPFYLSFSPSP